MRKEVVFLLGFILVISFVSADVCLPSDPPCSTGQPANFCRAWVPSNCCQGDIQTCENCDGKLCDNMQRPCDRYCPPEPPPCVPSCGSQSACCGSQECGSAGDGCGGSYSCGSCSTGYSCSGGSCVAGVCVSAGGVIANCGGTECCKFSGGSCPASWVQYQSWSSGEGESNTGMMNCYRPDLAADCCKVIGPFTCSIGSYSWSNQNPTCTSCNVCQTEGPDCTGNGANEKCGSEMSACQYRTEIGCVHLENCGDGFIEGLEECDDGDTSSGDGCDSSCQIEENWVCSGEPSVCEVDCQFTFSNWSVLETVNGTSVLINVQGEDCDGKEVKFEVFEKELVGRDSASVNPSNSIFVGNSTNVSWVAEWIDDGFGQGNPEYVFKASLVSDSSVNVDNSSELVVLLEEIVIDECANMTSCSNYLTSGECSTDACDIADGSVEANNPLVDCSADGTSCECAWSGSICEPSYTEVIGDYIIGTCSYDESTDDDCADGFLSYSWTKNWLWGHDGWADWNDGPSVDVGDYKLDSSLYYYDPNGKFDGCSDGSTKVECPASVQVGFFGFFQIVVVMIFLVGIYIIRGNKKDL